MDIRRDLDDFMRIEVWCLCNKIKWLHNSQVDVDGTLVTDKPLQGFVCSVIDRSICSV